MGRITSMPEPWRSLSEKMGGVQALAEAFGVSRVTVRRWAYHEIEMGGPARELLDIYCAQLGVEAYGSGK